jgi:hypothetical protein
MGSVGRPEYFVQCRKALRAGPLSSFFRSEVRCKYLAGDPPNKRELAPSTVCLMYAARGFTMALLIPTAEYSGLALKAPSNEIYTSATIFRLVTLPEMLFVIPQC